MADADDEKVPERRRRYTVFPGEATIILPDGTVVEVPDRTPPPEGPPARKPPGRVGPV